MIIFTWRKNKSSRHSSILSFLHYMSRFNLDIIAWWAFSFAYFCGILSFLLFVWFGARWWCNGAFLPPAHRHLAVLFKEGSQTSLVEIDQKRQGWGGSRTWIAPAISIKVHQMDSSQKGTGGLFI